MNGLPYYKRFPKDFLNGTVLLPFELKGAYSIVLDLIYMHGGKLPDNSRYIAGQLSVSVRKWNSFRSDLLASDKIQIIGEFIQNYRAVIELETLSKFQDKQRENRSTPNKNKDLQSPKSDHSRDYTDTDTELSKDICDLAAAFALYNHVAKEADLPKAQVMTPSRKSKLTARLKSCDGMSGWKVAMDKLLHSDYCAGKVNGWKADFDFVLQEKSFTRLMEGSYDNRASARPKSKREKQTEVLREYVANSRTPNKEQENESSRIHKLAFDGLSSNGK